MAVEWYAVCEADDLRPGQAASIRVNGRTLAVFNAEGGLHGMEGTCLHQKANLAAGTLHGPILECAMHGWEYDVRTGECLTLPGTKLELHPIKVDAGKVWIGLELEGPRHGN